MKRLLLVLAVLGFVAVSAQPAGAAPIPITANIGPAIDPLVPAFQAPWQPNLLKTVWTSDPVVQTVGDVTTVRVTFQVEQGGELDVRLPSEAISLSLAGPEAASWSAGSLATHIFANAGVYTLTLDLRGYGTSPDGGTNPFGMVALAPVSAVPEPASILLLGVGLIGLAAGLRRVPRR